MTGERIAHWWRIGFVSLGAALIAISVIYYLRGLARRRASVTWQRTDATIIGASVRPMERTISLPILPWLPIPWGTEYQPNVEYSYDAGGPRRGSRPFLNGRHFATVEECEKWLATMQPGAKRPVWFDPIRPDDSALVITGPLASSAIILALTGAAVIFMGFYMASSFTS